MNPSYRANFLWKLCLLSLLGFVFSSSTGLRGDFSDPNFVEEEIYRGNGMISMAFDDTGRLYVTEKQGRLLLFEPNDMPELPITYQYFEGSWNELPDFDSLTPVASGSVSGFSLEPRLQDDNFAFRYNATLTITTEGDYTFYTTSDDGSSLSIDGALIVDNDGAHGNQERSGTINLTPGTYDLVVEFFEAGGGENLDVEWEGPNFARQTLGGAAGDFVGPTIVADLSGAVNTDGERGMLGLALDPDFANTRLVYLFYSTGSDQRLTRITLEPDFSTMTPGSEIVLLSGLPNVNPVHNAGDIHFDPADPFTIYVMLGDDGDRYLVDDLDLYNGKLLRVDAATGEGLSDNPFWDGNPDSVRSRIWAHSFRNAFRFCFDPATPIADVLYVSENGDGTDRLARIEKGADGGWPDEFTTDSVDGKRRILRTTDPSVTGIAIIRGGPFAPDGPVVYQGRYGGDDRKEIRRWNLTGADLDTLEEIASDNGEPFLDNFSGFNIVSLTEGPDGALYFTDSNQGNSTGTGYLLGRIRYIGGEPPVAAFSIDGSARGEAPFTVDFTDESTAPDSTVATWSWDFGDGGTSTQPSPQHTFDDPGVYTVSLTVTNTDGLPGTTTATVTVYRTVTLNLTGTIDDVTAGTPSAPGVTLDLHLYQSDGITPAPASGGSGTDGNAFTVPANGLIDITTDIQLSAAGLVVTVGEGNSADFVPATSGFEIDLDEANDIAADFHLATTALHGKVLDTLGLPAVTDIGLARDGVPFAVAGGRDFVAHSPQPPTGVAHRHDVDALGYFYFAIPAADADADFTLDAPGDTGASVYGQVTETVAVSTVGSYDENLVLGLYDGGTGVDDLSGIAVTPDVDYETQIQPIFTSQCVACHNDIATNSGGLDLQAGASYSELVNRISVEAKGVMLVEPGSSLRSYLMEKIGSAQPQRGTRMRPNDPLALESQALIRDWISQLSPYGVWRDETFGVNANDPEAEEAADFDNDGIPNLAEFTLMLNALTPEPTPWQFVVTDGPALHLPAPRNDVAIAWEYADTLPPVEWLTVASRPAYGAWTAEAGFAVQSDPATGALLLIAPEPGETASFYRLRFGDE